MRRILAAFVMICCTCVSQAFPQSSGESDPSQSLVRLNVAAVDSKGAPVTDLHPTDIQVREDGVLHPLVFFRFAGTRRLMAPPGLGEFINRPGAPPTLILLDRWNERLTTMASSWDDVSAALAHLESVERVYIYFLTNHGDLLPVHPLPGAMADLRTADQPTSAELISKLNDAVRSLYGLRDLDLRNLAVRVDTTLGALGTISRMAMIAGRKNLIWVTHGFPLGGSLPNGYWADFTAGVRNVAQTAAQLQVAIYTVDQSEQGAGADLGGPARETLKMFSGLTGGRLYGSGSTKYAIAAAIADGRGNYQLAYYSSATEKGWKEHTIRLQSLRKDVRLLARQSYFGVEAEPGPDEVAEVALDNESHCPFEATEIALRVTVSPKPVASLLHFEVHVDPADVLMERRGERFQGSLSVALALYRNGVFQRALPPIQKNLNFTQEEFNTVLENGIVIPQDVPVSDQIQHVRVMVFDRRLRGLGSVTIPTR